MSATFRRASGGAPASPRRWAWWTAILVALWVLVPAVPGVRPQPLAAQEEATLPDPTAEEPLDLGTTPEEPAAEPAVEPTEEPVAEPAEEPAAEPPLRRPTPSGARVATPPTNGASAEGSTEASGERPILFLPRSEKFLNERVDIAPGDIPAIEFIRFLADYTGLNVIVSATTQNLQQPITIAAEMKDVSGEVVVAILEANNFLVLREVLPSGEEVLRIAATTGVPTPGQEEPKPTPLIEVDGQRTKMITPDIPDLVGKVQTDEIATMVFTLRYTQPSDAITSLQNLMGGLKGRSKSFSVVEVKNTMLLIVTAKFGLLPFIQELLKLIDVPIREPERIIQIIDVENADADELVALIEAFLQGRSGMRSRTSRSPVVSTQPGGARPPTATPGTTLGAEYETNLIADWRTQKIIVETYSERDLEDINMLVRELDTRFDIRRLKTRIYQVRYLKAEEIAQDLQSLIGGGSYGLSGRSTLGTRTASRTTRTSGVSRVGRGATAAAAPSPVSPAAGGGQNAMMPALIVPHIETNSLIIQAEPEEYAEILNILEQIDVKRRQVFLEAALVQVTTDSRLNYTIELLAGEPNDTGTRALFESSFGLTGIDLQNWNRTIPDLSDPASVPQGGLFTVMNRGKFPAIVQFFKSNTDTEVLATPFILADDNQTNVIDIIETKFVQNTSTGASGITSTSQEGEDAGITLEITPTISSQSAVFLELSLIVSQFTGEGTVQVLPPKISNTVTSAVTIPDGEIFVIGGLTRETRSKSVSKIPLIGDIPILGKLFRSESTSKSASNLYIFLRAHVLTHPEFLDGIDITNQADALVRDFAPEIEYVRIKRPDVVMPPPKAVDPDAPVRTTVRSRYSEGFEAPQGPYRPAGEIPVDSRAVLPGEETGTESPLRREEAAPVRPEPRVMDDTSPALPAGGLTRPPEEIRSVPEPLTTEPPIPEPGEATGPEGESQPIDQSQYLQGQGMEADPEGASWLIPFRSPERSGASTTPQDVLESTRGDLKSSESWLGPGND